MRKRTKITPEKRCWYKIKYRCCNPNNKDYVYYGGRGIKVCDRWLNSFENFLEDMGPRPSNKHSIDRIDNNGDYEPSNCRWALHKDQCNNRRSNKIIKYEDAYGTSKQWAEFIGISKTLLHNRLTYCGWSIEKALTTPVKESFE